MVPVRVGTAMITNKITNKLSYMSTWSRWRGNKEWQAEGWQRSNLVTLAGQILKIYPVFYSEGYAPLYSIMYWACFWKLSLNTFPGSLWHWNCVPIWWKSMILNIFIPVEWHPVTPFIFIFSLFIFNMVGCSKSDIQKKHKIEER